MKRFFKAICPPVFIPFFGWISRAVKGSLQRKSEKNADPSQQDLDMYWTEEMAEQLETWGKAHTWNEIKCLMINCKGKVLDIACGTGVNIKEFSAFPFLEVHGFDISELLLKKAAEKGIDPARLRKSDATKTDFVDNEFDYSYSIGSLEHFTEPGIDAFLSEASRYTSKSSFHMIPVSESGANHGWIKRGQSYFNNSVDWWLPKFQKNFREVYVISSGWNDAGFSQGKWFVCIK